MPLPITGLSAAALSLLLIALSIDAISRRKRLGVPFGDGGDPGLMAAIRAHSNLIEYMPIGLTELGLLEAGGAERIALAVVAALFVAARVAHAYGLHGANGRLTTARSVGIVGTLLLLAVMSAWIAAMVARPVMGF